MSLICLDVVPGCFPIAFGFPESFKRQWHQPVSTHWGGLILCQDPEVLGTQGIQCIHLVEDASYGDISPDLEGFSACGEAIVGVHKHTVRIASQSSCWSICEYINRTELERSHFAYTFKPGAFPISEILFFSFIMRIDIKRVFWS